MASFLSSNPYRSRQRNCRRTATTKRQGRSCRFVTSSSVTSACSSALIAFALCRPSTQLDRPPKRSTTTSSTLTSRSNRSFISSQQYSPAGKANNSSTNRNICWSTWRRSVASLRKKWGSTWIGSTILLIKQSELQIRKGITSQRLSFRPGAEWYRKLSLPMKNLSRIR